MNSLKVLDVTLRDGGCVNDFNFGQVYMEKILAAQEASGVDVIEMGYIDGKKGSASGRTQYIDEKVIPNCMLLFRIIPVGCFGEYETGKITTKAGAIQFYLAGIEMNLILAYIASIIGLTNHSLCETANVVAFFNFGMALLSILPIKNSIGENVISILCGVESINDEVKRWLSSKEYRMELLHSGSKGIRRLIAIVIALILQIAYWVLTALAICLLVVTIVYAIYVIVTL